MPRLKLVIKAEYEVNDLDAMRAYKTTDPEKMAEIDAAQFSANLHAIGEVLEYLGEDGTISLKVKPA